MPKRNDLTPKDVMLNRIEASRANKHPTRMISINWTEDLYVVVTRAAKARGISKSAYVRRAAAAMAAFDQGLDYHTVMASERGTRAYGDLTAHPADAQRSLAGQGYGTWKIKELDVE